MLSSIASQAGPLSPYIRLCPDSRRADDGKQALPLFLCALIGVAVIATYCISFGRFIVEWLVGGISVRPFAVWKRGVLADCGQSCQTLVQRRELGLVSLPAHMLLLRADRYN